MRKARFTGRVENWKHSALGSGYLAAPERCHHLGICVQTCQVLPLVLCFFFPSLFLPSFPFPFLLFETRSLNFSPVNFPKFEMEPLLLKKDRLFIHGPALCCSPWVRNWPRGTIPFSSSKQEWPSWNLDSGLRSLLPPQRCCSCQIRPQLHKTIRMPSA